MASCAPFAPYHRSRRFVAMDRIIDTANSGPLYLCRPEIAEWWSALSTIGRRNRALPSPQLCRDGQSCSSVDHSEDRGFRFGAVVKTVHGERGQPDAWSRRPAVLQDE